MLLPPPPPPCLRCCSLASSVFPERKPPPTSPKGDASPAGSSASGKQVDQMAHSRGPALSGYPLHKGHFWTAKCFVLSMCPEKQGPNVLWFLQRGESESLLSWGHPKAAQADSQTLAPACASAFRRSRLFLPLLWEVRSVKATPRPSGWCQLSTRAGLPWVVLAGTSASVGTREGFQCPPRLGRSPETPSSILAWQARYTLVNQEEETSGLISPYMGGLPFILRLIMQAALSCRIDFLRTCSTKRRNWKCLADVAPLQVHVACGLSLKLQYRKSRWNVPGSPARPQLNPIIRFTSQTASHCTKSQEHILGCSTPIPTQSLHFPRSVTRPEGSMCFSFQISRWSFLGPLFLNLVSERSRGFPRSDPFPGI